MVRDGASAPPHHEELASLPPPLPEIDRGGAFGDRAAAGDAGADGCRAAAAAAGKTRRIFRHRAGFDRGQGAAAAIVRYPRPLECPVRFAGISQRTDPDLRLSRLWRAVR